MTDTQRIEDVPADEPHNMQPWPVVPKVYRAINAVTKAIGKEGIAKGRKNVQQGYSFRGVDDVYNALSPFLGEHGLCILPRMLSREQTERESSKGGALFVVVVAAEFDFVSVEDGTKHTVRTYGEAMDSADKATNKAMSAAYKYACMQAFSIPTEGDNDADSTTHEVKPATKVITPMPKEDISEADERRLVRAGMELIDLVNQEPEIDNAYKILDSVEPLPEGEYLWLWNWLQPHSTVRSRIKKILEDQRNRDNPPSPPAPATTRVQTGPGLKKTHVRSEVPNGLRTRTEDERA